MRFTLGLIVGVTIGRTVLGKAIAPFEPAIERKLYDLAYSLNERLVGFLDNQDRRGSNE